MRKKLSLFILPAFALLSPYTALAQTGINIGAIKPYSDSIINLINNVIVPVLFALAFLVFIYGVVNYFFINGSNEGKRAEGRQFILWSVIAFAVIVSVWGLVNLLTNFLSLNSGSVPNAPTINFGSSGNTSQTHTTTGPVE